jgi:sorting nexin-4
MDSDFDSVLWKSNHEEDVAAEGSSRRARDVNGKRRMSSAEAEDQPSSSQMDRPHPTDLGDGVLECTVGSPLKENDGTKDVYISYLVTTHVGCFPCSAFCRVGRLLFI